MYAPHILIVVDSLIAGGMERQVVELLKGLKHTERYQIALARLEHGGEFEEEAFVLADVVLPVKRRTRFDLNVVWSLIRHSRAAGVHLIHAFGFMSGLAGLIAARWLDVPIINCSARTASPMTWQRRIAAWTARHSDVAVSNSQAGLESHGLVGLPQARVIRNGVDLRRFEGVTPRWAIQEPTLCMVANFIPYKDHTTVIRALALARCHIPELRLVLVGRDGGTLSLARELLRELGLEEAVEFVTNTNYPECYIAGSDVCVLASDTRVHAEGISNAILEYMALGKPVVATDCGGNGEVVEHGVTGYLVPPHAPEALAERIAELLQMPQRAREMGRLGKRRVHAEFSLERMLSEYEGLYASLLREMGR